MNEMNTNQIIGIVIVALVIIGGAWYFFMPHGEVMTPGDEAGAATEETGDGVHGDTNAMHDTQTSTTTSTIAPGEPVTITYTKDGFSPNTITVQAGTTVTWVNNSTQQMWVGSDSHPSHTAYDGSTRAMHCVSNKAVSATTFDECIAIDQGGSWSFTFTNVGSWGYHNHVAPNDTGTVTVIDGGATGISGQTQ